MMTSTWRFLVESLIVNEVLNVRVLIAKTALGDKDWPEQPRVNGTRLFVIALYSGQLQYLEYETVLQRYIAQPLIASAHATVACIQLGFEQ